MTRTDVIVLGAGIVGTSIALHLAKRGRAVVLVDRDGPGEETSYGNAGVIEGNTLFPHPFPGDLAAILRVVFKRAPEANYHLSFLPQVASWLIAYRANSRPDALAETARVMRPLFARAVAEHEALLGEAGAERYLHKDGWIKVYRSEDTFSGVSPELALADHYGLAYRVMDADGARALEPSLNPVFRHAVHWPGAASISNPLAVTRAYAALFGTLGGVVLRGDARTLRRENGRWRVDTSDGPVEAEEAVVALGPWAPDVLEPLGLKLPMAVKRGYHQHFRSRGNAGLSRPIVDVDNGYAMAPMEQGIRITTEAEFADRDAPSTPVQLDRLLPAARDLFPLGEPAEQRIWRGARPCFADSRPVVSRAPGLVGLWLAIGHAHWGLTLGPATGRLIAEMMTGAEPFCDPAPYQAERFTR